MPGRQAIWLARAACLTVRPGNVGSGATQLTSLRQRKLGRTRRVYMPSRATHNLVAQGTPRQARHNPRLQQGLTSALPDEAG